MIQGIRLAIDDLNQSESSVQVPLWNIPYPRNHFFTGREDLLTQLTTALRTGKGARPQALSGLGGIGKTQIAIEYAYRSRTHYQEVFWVRADTRENAVLGFVTIAAMLQLPEKDAQDQPMAVYAVKEWLSTNVKWLLILDNADDPHWRAEIALIRRSPFIAWCKPFSKMR